MMAEGPLYEFMSNVADPLMRVATGIFLLPHGAQKLFGWFGADLKGEAELFESVGLRPPAAWIALVGAIQFFGGLFLIFGLFTRPVALTVTCLQIGTAVLVTRKGGWFWNRGGMEYSLFWAIAAFSVFCRGSGRGSLDSLIGWQL